MFKSNELEIMRVLWESGPLKPAEIQQRLPQPVKNSALRWQLAALMERKLVTRRKKGKAYYYQATRSQSQVLPKIIRRIADVFAGGSAVALIGQLADFEDEWSEEELLQLRRIASQAAAPSQSAGSDRSNRRRKKGGKP